MGFAPPPAHANANDADFLLGVTAFKDGKFDSARRYFEKARATGPESPALLYNLGSTYYKLGRYADAEQAFADCARDPAWAALASYNQGLAAWQLGRRNEAAGHFRQVWQISDDNNLAALALTMLERIEPEARQSPRGTIAINLGYDSNVLLSDQTQALSSTGKSDNYTELTATAGASLAGGENALRWEAALYDLRYFELHDFSISELQLGLNVPWYQTTWFGSAGGQWSYLLRDGNAFQQIATLKAGTTVEPMREHRLRFDLRYDQIDTLDNNYQFLAGRRLAIDVASRQPFVRSWMSYGLSCEINDRKDQIIGSDFYSYSPVRTALWWRATWPLTVRWQIEPSVRYRDNRYADADRHGGLVLTRHDKDWRIGLAARYRLTAAWRLTGEFIYSDNRSNFAEYSYTRHQILFGVMRPL